MVCSNLEERLTGTTMAAEPESVEQASLHAIVKGRVQGVFFRDFVEQWATTLGLTGFVRNLPGGRAVEVRAEGEKKQLEKLLTYLHIGPPKARVEAVEVVWSEPTGEFWDFEILY
jgi:acylphosphatase